MSGNGHGTEQADGIAASNGSSMSPGVGFETVWRELRPRTIAMLMRRGVERDVAEDVAQETAIRLLNNWHLLDEKRPTWPFVRRIALNCLVDRHRRDRFDTLENLPDRIGPHDVEEQTIARFRLSEVWRAMAGLNQKERAILLAEVGIAGRQPNDPATKMARYRARQKLNAAVGGSSAFSGVALGWRRLAGWVQLHGPTAYLDMGTAAGLVVIVSAAAVTFSQQPGQAQTRPQLHRFTPTHASERSDAPRESARRIGVRPSAARGAAAPPSAAQSAPPSKPRPAPSPTRSSASAKAGPARAETGTQGDATYVKICTGEDTEETYDDAEVTVVIFDDDQDPNNNGPECRHGEQP